MVAVIAILCALLVMHNQTSTNNPAALEASESSATVSATLPTIEPAVAVVETPSKLPHVDSPRGSWEEA
ncbi:MAG: hypothetical protein F4Z01_01675 [Gammaproteobacteria bacterium]|nr:hypothetical protein [Gammaproteobacteria bacterium]MYF37845.1 hypothetical protein [Gammaproteobacteria bacterium]